jgi:hypothetical protein
MKNLKLLLCLILLSSILGGTAKAQTLIKTADISSILSPDGVGRPDVIAIEDTLYLAYSILTERNHHLVKMQADTSLTVLSNAPIELYSGTHDFSVDIRVSKANNKLWYAFEDNEWNAPIDSTHFLNAAWNSENDILIGQQIDIAIGITTGIPEAFSVNPNDVPLNPEAVDDPTPFWHNNLYYVFTRAWSGWIPEFTPNQNHHIRVFNDSFELIDDYMIDFSSIIPGKTLSQNVLIEIDGQVYNIGGYYNARNDIEGGSYIYAIPLNNDLTSTINGAIPLLTEEGNWFHKVTAAKVYNGYLFINYQEYIAGNDKQKIGIFDIENNYELITTLEISSFPLGGGGVIGNHTSFEILNDMLFVFYPELNQRIFVKIFSLDDLLKINDDVVPISSNILNKNYPNPFNPSTLIDFSIQNDSKVELSIYNIKGQKIKTLTQNEYTKGNHSIIWNGDNENDNPVNSGVYLYKLNVNGKTEAIKKCLLLK